MPRLIASKSTSTYYVRHYVLADCPSAMHTLVPKLLFERSPATAFDILRKSDMCYVIGHTLLRSAFCVFASVSVLVLNSLSANLTWRHKLERDHGETTTVWWRRIRLQRHCCSSSTMQIWMLLPDFILFPYAFWQILPNKNKILVVKHLRFHKMYSFLHDHEL